MREIIGLSYVTGGLRRFQGDFEDISENSRGFSAGFEGIAGGFLGSFLRFRRLSGALQGVLKGVSWFSETFRDFLTLPPKNVLNPHLKIT